MSTRRGAVAPEPPGTCPGNLPSQPMESYSLQLQLPRWTEPMDPFALHPVQPTVHAEQGQRPGLKEAGLSRGTGLRRGSREAPVSQRPAYTAPPAQAAQLAGLAPRGAVTSWLEVIVL